MTSLLSRSNQSSFLMLLFKKSGKFIVPRINLTHNLLKTIKTFCGFTNTGVTNKHFYTCFAIHSFFFIFPISELPLISHSFLEQLKTQQYFPLIQIPQTLNVDYLNADSMATSPSCPGTSSSLTEWPLALICKKLQSPLTSD